MVNYELGKIYKIVCDKTGLIYVGSTAQKYISLRLGGHRSRFRNYKRGGTYYTSSFKVLEHFAERIELIEMWPCSNKYELEKRERYWIEKLDCVNMTIPTRTDKEYYKDNKEKIKEKIKVYRDNNKVKLKEYIKEYRDNNKVKLKEYNKVYRENNKDKLNEKKKVYYHDNKERDNIRCRKYYQDNKERRKEYQETNKVRLYKRQKELADYQKTWCGNFKHNTHNNLLRIDVNLFN